MKNVTGGGEERPENNDLVSGRHFHLLGNSVEFKPLSSAIKPGYYLVGVGVSTSLQAKTLC